MKNAAEEVVAREFERLRATVEGVPDGDEFRDDVMAYALNRLPPRYVAQRAGTVLTALSMESDQERAKITVILLEAIDVVKRSPRESRP